MWPEWWDWDWRSGAPGTPHGAWGNCEDTYRFETASTFQELLVGYCTMVEVYGQALLVCDATARDPSGKTTLYGIFDRIWFPQFPAIHPLFSIYWRCVVPGSGRVWVSILKPDKSTLLELEPVETDKKEVHSMQGTYTLGGFEFPAEGEYTFILKYNEKELLRSSLLLAKAASANN